MTDEQKRLTREEWAREQAYTDCLTYGHEWTHVQDGFGEIHAMFCSRGCGHPGYNVTLKETT